MGDGVLSKGERDSTPGRLHRLASLSDAVFASALLVITPAQEAAV